MSRTSSARSTPPHDEEPVLADEAPPTHDGDADLAPDASVEASFHDEAQHAPSDLGEVVAPDASVEADFLDAAPRDPDDPEPELPPPPPRRSPVAPAPAAPAGRAASSQPFTGAWREPVLPPRRVARRSARDELMADLPAPSSEPSAGPAPPAAPDLQIRVTPRPGDPADVLPPEVRVKVLEARSRRDESMAAAIAREARRTRTIAVGMALLGLFTGGVTGSLCLPTATAAVIAALVDAALLGAAGFVVYRGGGGTVRGLGAFGAAAVVSAGVKVGLGAIGLQGMTDIASFALLVGLTLGATLLGGFLGQRLDQLVLEDGT